MYIHLSIYSYVYNTIACSYIYIYSHITVYRALFVIIFIVGVLVVYRLLWVFIPNNIFHVFAPQKSFMRSDKCADPATALLSGSGDAAHVLVTCRTPGRCSLVRATAGCLFVRERTPGDSS